MVQARLGTHGFKSVPDSSTGNICPNIFHWFFELIPLGEHCWRASDDTAAMLDDKTRYKSVFRPWELIKLFIQAHFTKTMDFVN